MISGLITIVLASELKHSTESLLSGVVPATCRDTTVTSQPDSAQPAHAPSSPKSSRAGLEEEDEQADGEDRYGVVRKVVICLLLTLIILIPAVAAILISKAGHSS